MISGVGRACAAGVTRGASFLPYMFAGIALRQADPSIARIRLFSVTLVNLAGTALIQAWPAGAA